MHTLLIVVAILLAAFVLVKLLGMLEAPAWLGTVIWVLAAVIALVKAYPLIMSILVL